LYLDRTRLRWNHFAVVAACYGVLGLGWGLFIAKAPDLFVAQFFGNAGNRLAGPMTLTRIIKGEVTRYLSAYDLENAHGLKLALYLLPVAYLSAIAFCVLSKDLRRRSKILLVMFVAVSLTLAFLEGSKQGWYLVHLSPLFCAFLAISATRLRESGNMMVRMVTAALAFIVLFGVARVAYLASNQNLQRLYQPAVAFLNAHVGPDDVVFARSEFYFGLKCRTCLRDDENLGAFSGRRAQYIVLDPDYIGQEQELRKKYPELYSDIEKRLSTEYQEVFRNANYQVMRRIAAGF
jgi:hypothetical protein